MNETPFLKFLHRGGGVPFQTEDVLAAVLPLFRQVAAWHDEGFTAPEPLLAALEVGEPGVLSCAGPPAAPVANSTRIEELQRPVASALNVIGHSRITSDDETGTQHTNLDVIEGDTVPGHPAYIAGYRTWEESLGHHDALTDIFSLGQILASLALNLDFADADDLGIFASHRSNLFAVNPRLHPVIASVIVEMTELNRHRRTADLHSLTRRLETYREQSTEVDFAKLPGLAEAGLADRRKLVQGHLRDRLFDISRRNRLLYFRPSQASLNFTVASVPLVMNLASIRLEQLFVWQPSIAAEITACKPMNLGRWLRFEDQPYLPGALDKLIADARRDRSEFGFAQLRLVVAFLHWHNLKETQQERILSPLLLLPAELTRKKGVRDQYLLEPTSHEAEVNPVLRHHLHQLYGLLLPEAIDLRETPLEQFYAELEAQIRGSEPGVTLRLVDKPEIELIHQRARQRLAQFQRRQKLRAPAARTKSSFAYSYGREDFKPLGLQLFREKILAKPMPQRLAAGGVPDPRMPNIVNETGPVAETERQTFALREQRPGNPYAWDFDLCAVTLGNFNYRKMSLVRDYGALLEKDQASEVFDRVFSLDPRPMEAEPPAVPERAAQWPVVQGDATQGAAVSLARTGRSYIIQGPPGTGKSQTITNLIADYVARGRRVLFVCEKRAAIDVVFHRLRQQGLDELCCLIHDSQTDKKAFITNLRQTYEKWLAEPDGAEEARDRRAALLKQMEQDLESLGRFDAVMRGVPEHVALPVRELLHRLVELREHEPALATGDAEHLPSYAMWREHGVLVGRIAAVLAEVTNVASLAGHPFRRLGHGVIGSEHPMETLRTLSDRAEVLLDDVETALGGSGLPEEYWNTLEQIEALASFATQITLLAGRGQVSLLDAGSQLTGSLEATVAELAALDEALEQAREPTQYWRDKLPSADIPSALAEAVRLEKSVLRVVTPSWWRLKRVIEARYDFSRHTIRPAFSQVLAALRAEYTAQAAAEKTRLAAEARFYADPAALLEWIRPIQQGEGEAPGVSALRALLLASDDAGTMIERLGTLAPRMAELVSTLDSLLIDFHQCDLATLGEAVRDLREEADALPDLLPLLSELAETPAAFAHAIRRFAFTPEQFEAAIARANLEEVYRENRWLSRIDGRVLAYRTERITKTEREWLSENAGVIRAEVRRRFRENVRITSLSATQLDGAGKLQKKSYGAGRRELEHEFGKTMRYKSIRDLAAGDAGKVVRDLKPVWLMSPLSVSDTLPLASDVFDVVIFDEASQVPVEEAVPALYRARQVIVVGDEMQLPPTKFFSAARSEEEEEVVDTANPEGRVVVALDADSFLTQCAKNLPATLLAWHYRSRSESLIGFSNAAFYAGNLYTIPDRILPAADQGAITVSSAEDAARHVEALLGRPLSFHFMERSPYEGRRNHGEAAYIARLVRELLQSNTGLSIGIVAFSEAQQGEIESALEALASTDASFAALLEEEYAREENDQFCGLFVKNLENVQGDERDIIILSICYGQDAGGRMLMNFGPINQRGGEKRLNVIFSRARHHMAVVSSIRNRAITNDYNDGAAALKSFLNYAECVSRGDLRLARGILENLNPLSRKQLAAPAAGDAVIVQLGAALRDRGLTVQEHVGQSRFRCDLAVRVPAAKAHTVGILVDTGEYYAGHDFAERLVARPAILRTFGWRVLVVLTRDWYHEPQAILDRVERLVKGEAESAFDDSSIPEDAARPESLFPAPEPRLQAPAEAALPGKTRRLELIDEHSSKFWEITQTECAISIRFGRIGANGQVQTKEFADAGRASREVEKLASEKLRKGYREVT